MMQPPQVPQPQDDQSAIDATRLIKSTGGSGEGAPVNHSLSRVPNTMIGEFKLLKPLGKGGMAEVWLAEQTSLKRNVALKLLRSEFMADQTYVKRFQSEAKAAAVLNHPNLVQVFTVGFEGGQHFISQEYVQGQTLKSLLKKRGPLDVALALHIMRQVAAALEVAGNQGIVHRDIKPENIMLTTKGQAKVADFGLAQLQGGERLNLTQEGVTMGTPLYMSPEQVSGRKVDPRSDLYSFGITSYHMLAGRPPFQGENAVQVAVQHLNRSATPLDEVRPDLPKAICAVVARMMAKNPDDRYPSAGELLLDLRQLTKALKAGEVHDLNVASELDRNGLPKQNRGWILTLASLFLGCVSAGTGWYLRPGLPEPDRGAIDGSIKHMADAKSQYQQAMLLVDNADAFRAVKIWFSSDADKIWVHRSEEQLALLYLHDRRYWDRAEKQLDVLENLKSEGERFYAEARIGRAALAAFRGDTGAADRILKASVDLFQKHLAGSWLQLEEDVRQLVEAADYIVGN